MTPATCELLRAIVDADIIGVQNALAAGADVNATDERGRNVVSYAALGSAIDAIDTMPQPQLSGRSLEILRLITLQPELSLFSLNAPMAWAGGVTLLALMSWLNMPLEISCLLEFGHGLLEANAMDDHGATPLMYAARDGNLQVVQRLLAHGARPDLKDISQRSTIEYALPHPQLLWVCEEILRRSRQFEFVTSSTSLNNRLEVLRKAPHHSKAPPPAESFFCRQSRPLSPPCIACFDDAGLRRTYSVLLRAIRKHDADALRTVLFPPNPASDPHVSHHRPEASPWFGTSYLVNFRDGTGLTLVHHAVSQRPYPSIAILDVLYCAGSDVGLFSTLGFSPLHHLARTARDDPKGTKSENRQSHCSIGFRAHPLYKFTMHLVRTLHAPLRAVDSKDETPLHAAAEHGRSVSVLLAMLDCDREFSGIAAVREMRNERGLRPADVAKSEFIPLFLGRHHSHPILRADFQRDVALHPSNHQHTVDGVHVQPHSLARKESSTSLLSKSSGSSSTSSGIRSYGSNTLSTYRSQRPYRIPKPSTPFHSLPTPEATPPSSFANPPSSLQETSVDEPACSADVLHHLSFCAYALYAYAQRYTDMHGVDTSTLPELPALSDTLLFTRDLASHVLEHWTSRLESVKDEFERARRELSKAKALREQVGWDIQSGSKPSSFRHTRSTHHVGSGLRKATSGGLQRRAVAHIDLDIPDVSEDVDESELSPVDSEYFELSEDIGPQVLAELDRSLTARGAPMGSKDVESVQTKEEDDTLVNKSVQSMPNRRPSTSELTNNGAVKQNVMAKTSTIPLNKAEALVPQFSVAESLMLSPQDLTTVPNVLQHADQDLNSILDNMVHIEKSYIHAHQSIARARTLIEESIQVREEQLAILLRVYHRQDKHAPSSRLSPILERSPDSTAFDTTTTTTTTTGAGGITDSRYIAALAPIQESRVLRKLLTRKLAKHVDRVSSDLEKVQTWLRVVREVLRGLRRRTLIKRYDDFMSNTR